MDTNDMNGGGSMPGQGMPMNGGQMPGQGMPMNGGPMPGPGMPMNGGGMSGPGMPMYQNGYVQQPQGGPGMAIASMIFGILGMITCCFPIVPLVCSVLALILGIVSLVKKRAGKGMAIAGIVCGAIAFLPGVLMTLGTEDYMKAFKESFNEAYKAGQEAAK